MGAPRFLPSLLPSSPTPVYTRARRLWPVLPFNPQSLVQIFIDQVALLPVAVPASRVHTLLANYTHYTHWAITISHKVTMRFHTVALLTGATAVAANTATLLLPGFQGRDLEAGIITTVCVCAFESTALEPLRKAYSHI